VSALSLHIESTDFMIQIHTHRNTQTHTQSHYTHTHTQSHYTHTNTHMYIHTHKHTHTHTPQNAATQNEPQDVTSVDLYWKAPLPPNTTAEYQQLPLEIKFW